MALPFSIDTPIKEIVQIIPRSTDIFKHHSIDFCCGGNKPLKEALSNREVSEEEIMGLLVQLHHSSSASSSEQDWSTGKLSDLIDHIIKHHHNYLKEELPQLSQLLTRVRTVHGDNNPELIEIHRLFHTLKTDLEDHTEKEEKIVFPTIRQLEQSNNADDALPTYDKIIELEKEHAGAGDILTKLRTLSSNYHPPEGACTTYLVSFRRLKALQEDLFDHIHLENNILFPRFEEALNK